MTLRTKLQRFRKAVTAWLCAERATLPQAMAMQFALEAGLIDGYNYGGDRTSRIDDEVIELYDAAVAGSEGGRGAYPDDADAYEDCGCLLDTLERVGGVARAEIADETGLVFLAATQIEIGDSPKTNPWSRAAVRGVADYMAEKEAA